MCSFSFTLREYIKTCTSCKSDNINNHSNQNNQNNHNIFNNHNDHKDHIWIAEYRTALVIQRFGEIATLVNF